MFDPPTLRSLAPALPGNRTRWEESPIVAEPGITRSHRRLLRLLVLWAAIALMALPAVGDGPREPRIEGLAVAVDQQQAVVDFRLADAFSDRLVRRVDSGLPTEIVYRLTLSRDRKWFDRSETDTRLQVTAMFNAVTGEYLINFKHEGQLIESRLVRDRDGLRRAMTEIVAFPAFSTEGLRRGERYLIQVRAELGTRNLLGFIPSVHVTPWVESEKFALSGP